MRSEIVPVPMKIILCASLLALGGCDRRSGETEQGSAPANQATAAPTSDEVPPGADGKDGAEAFKHTLDRSHKGKAPPADAFLGPDGKATTLAKIAPGKPKLVNLWATWCAPCIAELPALARLAGAHPGITLVTVSQDAEGPRSVEPFLAGKKLTAIPRYLDPENKLGFAYATGVLPTTVLYDAGGREVVRVVGALDWEGAEGKALLAQLGEGR